MNVIEEPKRLRVALFFHLCLGHVFTLHVDFTRFHLRLDDLDFRYESFLSS